MDTEHDPLPDFDLDKLVLYQGAHNPEDDRACVLEAVNRYVRLKPELGDTHECIALQRFATRLNDCFGDDDVRRTAALRELVPALAVAEVTPSLTVRRGMRCLDWLVRHWLPVWLDLVPALAPHAAALRDLPVVTEANAKATGDVIRAARTASSEARDAARAAAGAAAWDAARAAAGDAAGAAAWAAARDAARDAARAALRPTVERLQGDATVLLRELCEMRTSDEDKAAE